MRRALIISLLIGTAAVGEAVAVWWFAYLSDSWAVTWHFTDFGAWFPWLDGVLVHGAFVVILLLWGLLIYNLLHKK